MNRDPLNHEPFAKRTFLTGAAILLPLALLLGPTSAQTPHKKDARTDVPKGVPTNVQLELVRTETGFFEAWKTKDDSGLHLALSASK
jgi:hypothetical protein